MTQANRCIVLIDDEPFILSATAQLLRSAGHEVHTCQEWASVAGIVRTSSPDLILLDYNMPALRGDDICTILKRNTLAGHAKIVIFSSEPESDLVSIVERCGADGYIKKNCAGHALLRQVERVLDAAVA